MHKLLLLLGFLLTLCASAIAQRPFEEISKFDSLGTSSTITQLFGAPTITTGFVFKQPYYYSVYIQSDSISGSNAGTVVLQVSNDRAGVKWKTIQTLTIDGAASQTALWEGLLYGRRIRLLWTSPSGTRKTRIYSEAVLKAVPGRT